MLELLLPPGDFVPHELVERDGTMYSSSSLFVREGVDLLAGSVMRDNATGMLSLPPFYDFGGAFGTFGHAAARLAQANPQLAMLFVNWEYRNLDPSWDYSWCDLGPLEGFGETVEDMLGQCEELVSVDHPAFARMPFESQLAYVAPIVDREPA